MHNDFPWGGPLDPVQLKQEFAAAEQRRTNNAEKPMSDQQALNDARQKLVDKWTQDPAMDRALAVRLASEAVEILLADPVAPTAEPRFYVDTETDGVYTHYVIKDRQTGTTRPFAGGTIRDKRRADAIADQYNQHVPPDSL